MSKKHYGWLDGGDGWLNMAKFASSGGPSYTYNYGYPANGSVESNVVAQWLADESSGLASETVAMADVGSANPIVDEVASESLAAFNTSAGSTNIYRMSTGDTVFEGGQAGVGASVATSAQIGWKSTTLDSSLDFGTSDLTIETWITMSSTQAQNLTYIYAYGNFNESGNSWLHVYYNASAGRFTSEIRSDDGTGVSTNFTIASASVLDDALHKYRVVYDRSGNIEMFQDGVSLGTGSISALSAKAIAAGSLRLIAGYNDGNCMTGTLWEHRYSQNATNNSGGPGGG